MATQITKWRTVDGEEFETEVEALRHESKVLGCKVAHYEANEQRRDRERSSSYGSSGGGGHD